VPKLGLTSTLRTPGISRKLTFAFFAVILVVGMALPVTFLSFGRIAAASDQAKKSSVTLQNVATFQRKIGDVRASARDLRNKNNSVTSTNLTKTLRDAQDAARCIADPNKCEGTMQRGEELPPEEARRWFAIAEEASQAKQSFEGTMTSGGDETVAVNALDKALEQDVDAPSQQLAEQVADRGLDAQSQITKEIASSIGLLVGVVGGSILLASLLAAVIPRRLMKRLEHLRSVSHRLANGDLEARADERMAARTDEIGDLIADFNVMAMAMQRNTLELRTAQEQLHIALQQEQERATRDPLTGLRNHRYFQDSLSAEIERCRRTGGHVSIAVIDLDNFKQVNDRFGHSEGDAVLRRATKGISDNLRPYDLACRLGGEEFGVIFPEATADEAKMVLDRIADHIAPFGPNGERLSFSGGITTWPIHADQQTDLYQRADEASYAAKMQGKACNVIYDPAKVSTMDSAERAKSRSRDAMLTTATTLVSAVDQKDPYTRNHSELVAIYAATVARAMQLDEPTVKLVYRAGLLHDVGKIGISDEILEKGSQLTHDEWVQLRMHPEFSSRILEAAEMEPVATWTRHHHEHFDGTGYPMGIAGNEIPIGSRIILVADAFESMTSDRIYRRALGISQAMHELRTGAGRQFDPQVVQVMVQLIEQGVFTQVMQQYGRVVEPQVTDQFGNVLELDPAASSTAATMAALDGHPPTAAATSEAEAWAMQQIADESWAGAAHPAQSTAAQPATGFAEHAMVQPAEPQYEQPYEQQYEQRLEQPVQQPQAQLEPYGEPVPQYQQPEVQQAQVHQLYPQPEQPAVQQGAGAQWSQEQWDAYQQQAAQEQAAFDAAQAQAAALAHAQAEAHARAQAEAAAAAQAQAEQQAQPGFDPAQWAPPNPDDLAA
jgi:diguanylate cyclase (GGDEF)-like protein